MAEEMIGKVRSLNKIKNFGLAKCDALGSKDVRFPLMDENNNEIAPGITLSDYICFDPSETEKWLDGYQIQTYRKARPDELPSPGAPPQTHTAPSDEPAESASSETADFVYPYNFVFPAKPMHLKQPAVGLHGRYDPARHSGEIVCSLKTVTPLFVAGAKGWKEVRRMEGHTTGNPKIHWEKPFFTLPDGAYGIPGSTLKGMIRSLAEAASNSCFSVFTDSRFSYRLTRNLPARFPGRIIKKDDRLMLQKMEMARIGMEAVNALGLGEQSVLSDANEIEFKCVDCFHRGEPEVVWARHGERVWPDSDEEIEIAESDLIRENSRFFVEGKADGNHFRARLSKKLGEIYFKNNQKVSRCKIKPFPRYSNAAQWYVSELNGVQVSYFSGQGWVKWADKGEKTTKTTHQVFYDDPNKPGEVYPITDGFDIGKKYEIAQEGKDNKNPKQLTENQLVFFHLDKDGLADIGPVRMYKNVYRYSTLDLLKNLGNDVNGRQDTFTPCETLQHVCPACQLFGFIPEVKGGSDQGMAGRVFVFEARLETEKPDVVTTPLKILAGPKPKYYPFYLTAKEGESFKGFEDRPNGGHSWEDGDSRPRGRKFYWHHPNPPDNLEWDQYVGSHPFENGERIPVEKTDQNLTVNMMPPDCFFRFKIRFENLSDEELGLLLFAVDFNDDKDGHLCHRIGMGKPLGMGSVKVTVDEDSINLYDHAARYSTVAGDGKRPRDETDRKIQKARESFFKAMSESNGDANFQEIRNIRDILMMADTRNPSEKHDGVRYRPLNLKPDENYAWFGGGRILREGWRRAKKYNSPRQPLPAVSEVVDKDKKMPEGQW